MLAALLGSEAFALTADNDGQVVRPRPYSWAYSVDPVTFTPPVIGGWYPVLSGPPRPKPYTWAYSVDPIPFEPGAAVVLGWFPALGDPPRPRPYSWAYSVDPAVFTPEELSFGWLTQSAEISRSKPYSWGYSVDVLTFTPVTGVTAAPYVGFMHRNLGSMMSHR